MIEDELEGWVRQLLEGILMCIETKIVPASARSFEFLNISEVKVECECDALSNQSVKHNTTPSWSHDEPTLLLSSIINLQ